MIKLYGKMLLLRQSSIQFVARLFMENTTLCGKVLHFVVKHC